MTSARGSRVLAAWVLALTVLTGCGTSTAAGQQPPAPTADPAVAQNYWSPPATVDVPALKVFSAPTPPLGLDGQGAIEVPPLTSPLQAGAWAPEHPGVHTPTVILAHVNAAGHPGLFLHLKDMAPGDLITVHYRDGVEVTFTTTKVITVPKDQFPTEMIYGEQPGPAAVRLVTCGGELDRAAHSYRSNVIVLAVAT